MGTAGSSSGDNRRLTVEDRGGTLSKRPRISKSRSALYELELCAVKSSVRKAPNDLRTRIDPARNGSTLQRATVGCGGSR